MRPLAILAFVILAFGAAGAVACGGGAAAPDGGGERAAPPAAPARRGRAVPADRHGTGTGGAGGTPRPARRRIAGSGRAARSSCIGIKPTATNTGVPAGVLPSPVNGDVTITQDGTTIDAKDIHGFLIIDASHVRVTRSIVRGHATPYTPNTGVIRIDSGSQHPDRGHRDRGGRAVGDRRRHVGRPTSPGGG